MSTPVEHHTTPAAGAYGLGFVGSEAGLEALPPAPASWPALTLRSASGSLDREGPQVDVGEHEASVRVPGGAQVLLDRRNRSVRIVGPTPLGGDRLLHPTLGYIASVFSHWLGRLVLHGGAFAGPGGAVALLGARGQGKSSTLAWLAREGRSVLTDDVLVVDGLTAFAGPPSIDLWPDAAKGLGLEDGAHTVRGGERRRLEGAAAPSELPLTAWVSLAWGERVTLRPLAPQERYATLVSQIHVHVPGRLAKPETFLELLTLPAFELARPKRLESLPRAGAALLELAVPRDLGDTRPMTRSCQ